MRFSPNGSAAWLLALLIGSIALSSGLHAQPAGADPSVKNSLASPLEILQWEASIAENSYTTQRTDKRLTNLISVYERLIGLACMPQLQKSLIYKGSPTDPICLKYIDATLKLDAENPMAVCARDGIDGSSCESAWQAQDLGSYSSDREIFPGEYSPESQLELKLESARGGRSSNAEMESELYKLENAPLQDLKEKPERDRKVLAIYGQLISKACQKPKLKIISLRGESADPLPPAIVELLKDRAMRDQAGNLAADERLKSLQAMADARAAQSALPANETNSPMDQVVRALNSGKDVASEKGPRARTDGFLRWRLLNQECREAIKRATGRGHKGAAAICAEQGDFSPSCIRALRSERSQTERVKSAERAASTSGTPAPKPGSNFSTF